jgi:inosose dehydratase
VSIRFAINPIQWSATPDGWIDPGLRPPLAELLAQVRASGFRAVHAEPPAGLDIGGYRELLAAAGLEPAPGYFSLALGEGPEAYLEAAGSVARDHAALGLREVFVSIRMTPERIAAPARGAGEAPLGAIAAALDAVGTVMRGHGVTACLHPHVGSWVEVEDEIEAVAGLTDPELVALGPDTGHLAWAGVDPVAFTARHAARIRALHLKDVRLDVARSPALRGADYRTVAAAGLWVEPGRGDLDLPGVLRGLPAAFDGWGVIEVDRPDAGPPLESARVSAAWVDEIVRTEAFP